MASLWSPRASNSRNPAVARAKIGNSVGSRAGTDEASNLGKEMARPARSRAAHDCCWQAARTSLDGMVAANHLPSSNGVRHHPAVPTLVTHSPSVMGAWHTPDYHVGSIDRQHSPVEFCLPTGNEALLAQVR